MAPSHPFLYAMDPATTLYTFFLKTDPSIRTVRLIGSWDNFTMSYAMERDSRREGGQWRGCHTFKDIICDGDASPAASTSSFQKRNGGLKQGSTYYYYYEVDASTETHNPALPSTTTCPYLPGQRVNTLDVPSEKSSRQRSASVSSARRSDFKTMNPADKFVTPRPPPATPAVTPAAGPELRAVSSLSALRRPLSPLPSARNLLRHQRSVRSLSPAPSASAPSITAPSISAPSFSTWSPRRFFARRASPSREVTNADDLDVDAAADADVERDYFGQASIDNDDHASVRYAPPTRLPSSSSSISTSSRLRYAAIIPSSQGSRSRDISPESLRRFLVDDDVVGPAADTPATRHNLIDTTEIETDDDDLDFEMDYDDANFDASAASENAPFTVLSPPPPSRNATPVNLGAQLQKQQQQSVTPILTLRTSIPPPVRPARALPAALETSSIQRNPAQMNLGLEMPSSTSPTSSASISSMSSLSPMSQSDADDDEECYGTAGEPAALFLPPQHPFGSQNTGNSKSEAQQQQRHYRHHLFDAAFTGSTATLVPGDGLITAPNGNGLNELVDELGWMATAIRG
ncbi:hypothetical protein F503_04395 [Ophiostoma piceae UAMH 11346]|uniref:Uncharacterized protein n=1 Tax=Ophiostoma piceae (strain UAMH 11346) TaxID=1262450 RepID=S3CQE6_OPHP1|nr:hypothetical protein F503_04395 [Ophiostoma piceae UAMH 11346]